MSFAYDPADAVRLMDEGTYDAVIVSVEATKSKAGNDMLKLVVEVYKPDGSTFKVFDYIVIPNATFKLKQIADAMGKTTEFKAKTWDVFSMKDRRFSVKVGIKKSKNPEYDDANSIDMYDAPSSGKASPAKRSPVASPISDKNEFAADEIPF